MSASHPNASIDAAQVPATTELTAVRQQVRTVLEPVTETAGQALWRRLTPAGHPPPWRKIYQGGLPSAEQEHLRQLAGAIVDVQRENRQKSGAPVPRRVLSLGRNLIVPVGRGRRVS